MIKKILEIKKKYIRIIREDDTQVLNIIFKSQFIFKKLKVKNLQGLKNMKNKLEGELLDKLIKERSYTAMALSPNRKN